VTQKIKMVWPQFNKDGFYLKEHFIDTICINTLGKGLLLGKGSC